MRPHVETIDEKDHIWHLAELPHGTGVARQRNLSYDEEDGSCSARVEFVTRWTRPAGVHHAQTEWYVLSGSVTLGADELRAGDYWMAPAGAVTPPASVHDARHACCRLPAGSSQVITHRVPFVATRGFVPVVVETRNGAPLHALPSKYRARMRRTPASYCSHTARPRPSSANAITGVVAAPLSPTFGTESGTPNDAPDALVRERRSSPSWNSA